MQTSAFTIWSFPKYWYCVKLQALPRVTEADFYARFTYKVAFVQVCIATSSHFNNADQRVTTVLVC